MGPVTPDAQYKPALLEELQNGERAILEGKTSTHTMAKERMQQWLNKAGSLCPPAER